MSLAAAIVGMAKPNRYPCPTLMVWYLDTSWPLPSLATWGCISRQVRDFSGAFLAAPDVFVAFPQLAVLFENMHSSVFPRAFFNDGFAAWATALYQETQEYYLLSLTQLYLPTWAVTTSTHGAF